MIDCLYDCFKHWAKNGSVYIMSDTHFDDPDCAIMSKHWINPEEQIQILNKKIFKNDTLIYSATLVIQSVYLKSKQKRF